MNHPLFDLSLESQASLTDEIKNQLWDFVIIGAGPAGALAAYLLAPKNRVLLIDQADFPREKSCGGCLSRGALSKLDRAGLRGLVTALNGNPIQFLEIAAAGLSAKISVPEGLSVSRKKLDAALIEAAKQKGTVFLPSTKGTLDSAKNDTIRIHLVQGKLESKVRAKTALICDGLSGTALRQLNHLSASIAPEALVGLSTACESRGFTDADTIRMACSSEGYVGIAHREDRKIEVAAAVRPAALKAAGSSASLVEKILREAGCKIPEGLAEAKWLGAPSLSRRRAVLAGERFFVLGDAAGFVEPFTGEGMYWALLQAEELAALLEKSNYEWNPSLREVWQVKSRRILDDRQRICRGITLILRVPILCRSLIWILKKFPRLGSNLAQLVHGGSR